MEHDDHDPLAPDLTGGAPLPAFEQFPSAGVDMRLRIGQRVRHTDYKGQRVTGVVYGLSIEHDRGLMVDCRLDAPIVIPADEHGAEIKIWSHRRTSSRRSTSATSSCTYLSALLSA
jgi:ribulose 1,5-bisphosphate synthetase/thiazole synthase